MEYARQRLDAYFAAVEDLTQASESRSAGGDGVHQRRLTGVGWAKASKVRQHAALPPTDASSRLSARSWGCSARSWCWRCVVLLIYRGFTVARHAPDAFAGAAAGVTCGLRMTRCSISRDDALIPPTGPACRLSATGVVAGSGDGRVSA